MRLPRTNSPTNGIMGGCPFKENGQVSLIHEKRPNHQISKKKSINREFNEEISNKIKNRTRDQRGYVMEPSSKPGEQRTSKKYKQAKRKICRNNHSKKWSGIVT